MEPSLVHGAHSSCLIAESCQLLQYRPESWLCKPQTSMVSCLK
jgi:hypothetical protein